MQTIIEQTRYSECCGSADQGNLFKDSEGEYSGRCIKCGEGAMFRTEEELEAQS